MIQYEFLLNVQFSDVQREQETAADDDNDWRQFALSSYRSWPVDSHEIKCSMFELYKVTLFSFRITIHIWKFTTPKFWTLMKRSVKNNKSFEIESGKKNISFTLIWNTENIENMLGIKKITIAVMKNHQWQQ